MANEFKVKHGIKFPDNTIQTTAATGGASVTIDTTPPTSASAGDLWWNSEEGKLKVYYNDGDTSQWVDAFVAINGVDGTDGIDGADGIDGIDGVGVPAGGTTGQVLAKASETDYDTEWATPVTTGKAIAMAMVFG
jgi:hypothetical protein